MMPPIVPPDPVVVRHTPDPDAVEKSVAPGPAVIGWLVATGITPLLATVLDPHAAPVPLVH